jgi:type III restriction enzyme
MSRRRPQAGPTATTVYADIRSQAREPEHQDTIIPELRTEESKDAEGNLLPARKLHVLADQSGDFPVGGLNDTEVKVVDRELGRQHVVGWYRNPSQATVHSIRVPYRDGDKWRSMQPDFIFVSRREDGELAASIVDPHSSHLADALLKLVGLADFAERDAYLRIDALDQNSNKELVVLNMKDESVRAAVRNAASTADLYDGHAAIPYK